MKPKKESTNINTTSTMQPKSFSLWLPFIMFLSAFLLYANTISYEYTCDDARYTFSNAYVERGISAFSDIVSNGSQAGCEEKIKYVPDYRPLVIISFALENTIFGSSAKSNHFFNVLLYALLCMMLFLLLKKLFSAYNIWIPALITLLFITHPIHTEVVASVKSRDEILTMLFGIIATFQILKYFETNKIKFLGIGLFSFFCCLLSKESGFVFLGLIPLAIFFKTEISLKKNVLITLILVAISGLVLFLRFKAIGNVIDKGDYLFVWNPLLDAPNVGVRLATAFGVFLKTLLLLFFPINLSWDYSFNEIPFSSWSEPFTILAFLLYLSLLIIAIVGIKKRNNFSFAIWFYLIASIITSNLLFACPIIFSERGQFISSLGFCLIFPFLIAYVLKDKDFITNLVLGKNIRIVIIIVLVLFSIKTIYRSADWKNDETLYLSGVKTSPNSCRTHYSLANLYYDRIANATTNEEKQENLNLAIHEYRKALDIYPAYRQLYYNLGVAYFYKNNFDSSAYMYEKALSFDSADLRTVTNYAYLLFLKKDFKKSLDLYNRAIGLPEGKNLPVLYIGAGLCYRGLLDYNNAKLKFEMALKIQPGNKQAQNALLELESIKK